jgi:peptidoglycan-associated lipoprotein
MGDMMIRLARSIVMLVAAASLVTAIGCGKKKPPVAKPTAPPPTTASGAATTRVPAPPEPVSEPTIVPAEPVKEDTIASGSLDEINRNSPLKPVYFDYDSSDITPEGRSVLDANAAVMKKYPSWTVTIEGHTDERGTAEYNLALGERRAVTARAYLVSLGVSADRLRIVSYGKEFPFDPGHDESAFSRNRRAHFVITAK